MRRGRGSWRLAGAAALATAALIATVSPTSGQGRERLRVVTTIRPLFDFASQVAGSAAVVESLLPPGVGPHDYSFTPTDAVRLHRADVLVVNGLGLESWLEGLLRAARRDGLLIVDTSRGIEPLELPEAGHPSEGGSRRHEGRWDPHIWLDPLKAARQVENIRDGLAAADPANASAYRENARLYLERLAALDEELRAATASLPRRELMTFHAAFQYFARRYGLEVVAVVEPAPGKEPTPKSLAHIHEVARRHNLRVIYTEPQFRPRVAEVLARDLGLETAVFDPGVTGPLEPGAYEAFMRRNVEVLTRWQSR